MIAQLDELVKANRLEESIELRGSFCMERCGEGLNWQIGDLPITSQGVAQAVEEFTQRVLKPHTIGRTAGSDEQSGKD